ncbi:MAG: hypothetical protein U0802_00680 [Candidatus Binatia bacterium]
MQQPQAFEGELFDEDLDAADEFEDSDGFEEDGFEADGFEEEAELDELEEGDGFEEDELEAEGLEEDSLGEASRRMASRTISTPSRAKGSKPPRATTHSRKRSPGDGCGGRGRVHRPPAARIPPHRAAGRPDRTPRRPAGVPVGVTLLRQGARRLGGVAGDLIRQGGRQLGGACREELGGALGNDLQGLLGRLLGGQTRWTALLDAAAEEAFSAEDMDEFVPVLGGLAGRYAVRAH